MAKVSVFDMTGNQVSETELSDAVFGITPNEAVMHAMVVNYLEIGRASCRERVYVLV